MSPFVGRRNRAAKIMPAEHLARMPLNEQKRMRGQVDTALWTYNALCHEYVRSDCTPADIEEYRAKRRNRKTGR